MTAQITIRKLRDLNQQHADLIVKTLRDGGASDDEIIEYLRANYTEEVKPTLADAVVKAFTPPSGPVKRATANTLRGSITKAFLDGGFNVPDELEPAEVEKVAKARKAAMEKIPAVEHDMTYRLRKNAEARDGR